ncbi:DUF1254 domain-containing protein [Roseomonas sp. ACRSG]|nr:DUF1254 domain-containing protein [Roseomonas sp. ACRSG]
MPFLLRRRALPALLPVLPVAAAAQPSGATTAIPPPSNDPLGRLRHDRAVEAVIWGMPAVNYDLMRQQMLDKTAGRVNEVIHWGRPLDWRNQTLTPNPDTLYFMTFFDTKAVGPVVMEVPPSDAGGSLNGNIVNIWQMPLEDVGLLGVDKGAGGRFVFVPPGYDQPIPEGFTALRSDTHEGYALFRSNLASHDEADVRKSIDYGRRIRIYPLSAATNPPPTRFTDVKDVLFDSTIRYDSSFFDSLDRLVQAEAWLPRDRLMINTLRSIGIEKGKPFRPDAQSRAFLDAAIGDARRVLDAMYDKGWPSFFENTQWRAAAPAEFIKTQVSGYADPDDYPSDARGMCYTYGYIGLKRLGAGQFYLIAIRDRDGNALDGARTYRLTVPPQAPVEQYWSVTAYDRNTHALIRGMPRASRSSQIREMQKNTDGSIDVFFGPAAPAGQDANWVPTDAQRGFELMFRLYAPTKAFFDKAWVLPDLVRI